MDAKDYVVELLNTYPAKKRQIEQLKFELSNLPSINDDEIITSLALSSSLKTGGVIDSGSISDKTMMIALKYRDAGQELMSEAVTQILQELKNLEKETSRLEYYLSFLEATKSATIHQLFFEEKSIAQVAIDMDVVRGTVLYRKKAAITELTAMYSFINAVRES